MMWLLALYVAFSPLHIPDMTHRWPMLHVAPSVQIIYSQEPAEYPEGQYCTPKGDNYKGLQTPENPCACQIVMRPDKDGCCEIMQANDAKCKQFCHEHNCACPHECLMPEGK